MGNISDRLGEMDDNSQVWTSTGGWDSKNWWKIAVADLLALVVAGLWLALVPSPTNFISLGVASTLFVIGYVIWRTRRNQRLTGSPTQFPS